MTTNFATLKLHELIKRGNKYTFKKGQVVQSSDGRLAISLIEAGYIKRYQIINDGSIRIHGIYGPGTFFPLTLIYEILFSHAQDLYSGPETFYYETMCDNTVIYSLDNQTFLEEIKKDPIIYRGLLVEAGKRLHFYIQRLENLTLKTSYRRVAHQLAFYCKEFPLRRLDNSIEISVPLTHQTISDVLSLTRETVSQSMSVLRRKGLIKTGPPIVVLDINKLDEFSRS